MKACPFLEPEHSARIQFLKFHAGPGESDNKEEGPVELGPAPAVVFVEGARRTSAFLCMACRNARRSEEMFEGFHTGEAMADAVRVVGRGSGRMLR